MLDLGGKKGNQTGVVRPGLEQHMAQFLVKIADDRGRLAQQVENGYSESEVRERFVQQGYLVYWVKPRGLLAAGKLQTSGRKVKQSQFVIFNQQFLTLIKAGLP